jgi:tetratricopeptide (TPR) repeat protein
MMPSEDLPETPQTYWRWGLPSLILAIVTILLVLASQFVIEPSIDHRYESVVQQSISSHRLEDLKIADLAAQRLMVRYPDQSKYRRMHAEVNLEISNVANRMLSEMVQKDVPEYEQWANLSNATRSRARESIRSATRLQGVDGQWAKDWLIREETRWVRQSCRDESGRIQAIVDRYRQSSKQSDATDFDLELGALEIQLANTLSPPLEQSVKDGLLSSGVERIASRLERYRLSQNETTEVLIAQAWMAEGLASIEPARASQIAREAVLKYSSLLQDGSNLPAPERIEAFEAFFRCLMLISGPEEATSSILGRLEQIPSHDQTQLRHLAVASQLRAWASAASYPEGTYASIPSGALLKSALRLGPDHPDLVWLFEVLLLDQKKPRVAESDPFMDQLIWVRGIIQGDPDDTGAGHGKASRWSEKDLDVGLSLLSLLIQISRKHQWPWTRLEPIVDSMIEAYPSSPEVKLGRAILLSDTGRWEQAMIDLELLAKLAPENKLIEQLLKQAHEQAMSKQPSDPKQEHAQR